MSVKRSTETTFYIETYGCQMNEYDSMIAQNILETDRAKRVSKPDEADMILLNTCAIRENAHEKVYNRLRSLEHLHKRGAQIGVLGCMSQNLKEDLLYENLPIDFVMGPDSFRELPLRLSRLNEPDGQSSKPGLLKTAHLKLSRTETYDDLTPSIEHHLNSSKNKITAFVSIQRGCDNFCSFCVVPFTRGRERSRSVEHIVGEIRALSQGGFKAVVLLGQNVNSYLFDETDFHGLVSAILKKTNIERIYFTSPHPKDFPEKLIDLMRDEPRFCSQIHMPLQSGSNEVLKRMRRGYTRQGFLKLVDSIRRRVDDVSITTDVIVGFPGETQEQFQETLSVMEEASFDSAFMFAYSERKGTSASKMYPDDTPWEEKKSRLETLIKEQEQRSFKKNEAYQGRTVSVLVEGPSLRNPRDLKGSLQNGKKVVFRSQNKAGELLGKFIDVKIHSVTSHTLLGTHA